MKYQTNDRHMYGIVPVKESSDPFAVSALSIIQRQQRDSEPTRKVYDSVNLAVDDEESNCIH